MISPSVKYCQHIDNLKNLNDKEIERYIQTFPADLESQQEKILYAASIEYICNRKNLEKPNWISDEEFFSANPIFACNTQNKNFQDFLIKTSPIEYSRRNIFYGDKILRRA